MNLNANILQLAMPRAPRAWEATAERMERVTSKLEDRVSGVRR